MEFSRTPSQPNPVGFFVYSKFAQDYNLNCNNVIEGITFYTHI